MFDAMVRSELYIYLGGLAMILAYAAVLILARAILNIWGEQ